MTKKTSDPRLEPMTRDDLLHAVGLDGKFVAISDGGNYLDEMLPGDGRWTCIGCPVQAEGHLVDGRMWYFRARWGDWGLSISPAATDAVRDAVLGDLIAEGPDGSFGAMSAEDAAAAIRTALHDLGLEARPREDHR